MEHGHSVLKFAGSWPDSFSNCASNIIPKPLIHICCPSKALLWVDRSAKSQKRYFSPDLARRIYPQGLPSVIMYPFCKFSSVRLNLFLYFDRPNPHSLAHRELQRPDLQQGVQRGTQPFYHVRRADVNVKALCRLYTVISSIKACSITMFA